MRHRLFIILSCLFVSVTMLAQHKITGVVLDSEGEPAIGASVLEKGTVGNGAVTDIDGMLLNLMYIPIFLVKRFAQDTVTGEIFCFGVQLIRVRPVPLELQ